MIEKTKPSTQELVEKMFKDHPEIKEQLKEGLIKPIHLIPFQVKPINTQDIADKLHKEKEPKNCIEKFAKDNSGLLAILSVMFAAVALIEAYWIFIHTP